MVDGSQVELTSSAIQGLAAARACLGQRLGGERARKVNAAIARADPVLRALQRADGSWEGNWGICFTYGTWFGICGLLVAGAEADDPAIVRAVEFLCCRQCDDGGWGESPLADRDPAWRGRGTSTASQTAWATIGLLAGEDEASEPLLRGVQWLLERQNENGTWDENEFTGSGFPGHFYLRYWLYSHYFPLMALGRFRVRMKETVSG